MTGKTYIDGVDIFTTYGVWITEGGYNGLVAFPPLKQPDANDWQEEDGTDVDLSATMLDTREFAVTFAATKTPRVKDFITLLANKAYHVFDLREIGQTYTLRMIAQPNRQLFNGAEYFTLTFADDYPLKDYTYAAPTPTMVTQTGYTLDGTPLANYGVWVLQGTESEIQKTPAVKKNLLRNLNSASGAFYDGEAVTFQAKEVTLNFSLVAATLATFWQNYKALLYNLSKPGARQVYSAATGETFPCYYSNASVSKFGPVGAKVYCDFSVTLIYTQYRNPGEYFVAATEGANPIITENDAFIDMAFPGQYSVTGDRIKVSQLPEATSASGLVLLGVNPTTNQSVKVPAAILGGAGSGRYISERLTGNVNGTNKIFTASASFDPATLSVFLNGIRELNYSVTATNAITLTDAPKNIGFTDVVTASYFKQ